MKTNHNHPRVRSLTEHYQVVVCGGGLAGVCAALAAARGGAKTCIIQDRPVFGGNASSEVRVKPLGPCRHHSYCRTTGIIGELLIRERAENHVTYLSDNGHNNSVWDMMLYDIIMSTPNLSFHVNTAVTDAIMEDGQIRAIRARVANAETELTVHGEIFIDCTGDGVLAAAAGCEWRMGMEARSEFGESLAPEQSTNDTMGNSIHFATVDIGRPAPFTAPSWAVQYNDPDFFYKRGRHIPANLRTGFWWIELGMPWDTIHDAETIRHELTRHTLGIWDYIKNRDPKLKESTKNLALDWIGQVPGKRDSRRIVGLHMMTQHDVANHPKFADEVAYGGFYIDLHTTGGLLGETSEPVNASGHNSKSEAAIRTYVRPYGIPLGCLMAKDVPNLMMAGRNVSTTHVALGSMRVMTTTALMGQATGTVAALAIREGLSIRQVREQRIQAVQQQLLRDGCFLPNYRNEDTADLALRAKVTASSSWAVSGIGPASTSAINAHFNIRSNPHALDSRLGQWIAIGDGPLHTVSVLLKNPTQEVQRVGVALVPVEDIWDYRVDDAALPPLAQGTLEVPPGQHWITWPVNLDASTGLPKHRFVRLDLFGNAQLFWLSAGTELPGHAAAWQMAPGRLRGFYNTLSFRVSPAQNVFRAENATSGVTRPYAGTNMWFSDLSDPLPAWLQLQWDTPQTIREVQLTFPGNLNREYGHYPPYYREPRVAKEYAIEACDGGVWRELLRIEGNYQCLRRHALPAPVATDQLRIVIYSTNGEQQAGLTEIRCYG